MNSLGHRSSAVRIEHMRDEYTVLYCITSEENVLYDSLTVQTRLLRFEVYVYCTRLVSGIQRRSERHQEVIGNGNEETL